MPQINADRLLGDLYALRKIGEYKTGVHRPSLSWMKSSLANISQARTRSVDASTCRTSRWERTARYSKSSASLLMPRTQACRIHRGQKFISLEHWWVNLSEASW